MKQFVHIMLVICGLVWAYNAGLETGLTNKPEFDSSRYDEAECINIERREFGLVCEIRLTAEDEQVRIFKPKTSPEAP